MKDDVARGFNSLKRKCDFSPSCQETLWFLIFLGEQQSTVGGEKGVVRAEGHSRPAPGSKVVVAFIKSPFGGSLEGKSLSCSEPSRVQVMLQETFGMCLLRSVEQEEKGPIFPQELPLEET